MIGELRELIRLIADNDAAVLFMALGVACLIIAAIGKMPGTGEFSTRRSILLAGIGILSFFFGLFIGLPSSGRSPSASGIEPTQLPTSRGSSFPTLQQPAALAQSTRPPDPIPSQIPPTRPPEPTATISLPTPVRPMPASPTTKPAPAPLRPHTQRAIGTGPLRTVAQSDGLYPLTDDELATKYFDIQRFRREENPDGCGIALYNTDKVWFGSAGLTDITVNGQVIARLQVPTGKHGYMFEYPLKVDDKLCVTTINPSGYQIVIGPDVYYHFDSYCYRGHC